MSPSKDPLLSSFLLPQQVVAASVPETMTTKRRRRRRYNSSSRRRFSSCFLLALLLSSFFVFVGAAAATASSPADADVDDAANRICDANSSNSNQQECTATADAAPSMNSDKKKNSQKQHLKWKRGTLRPSMIPPPEVFDDFHTNTTITLPGSQRTIRYMEGSVNQINDVDVRGDEDEDASNTATTAAAGVNNAAEVAILSQAVPRTSIDDMLTLVRTLSLEQLDADPDTVDGMPSYEIFVESPGLDDATADKEKDTTKIHDVDEASLAVRRPLRQKLRAITHPILEEIITPFIRHHYPEVCARGNNADGDNDNENRNCTPCYSLIRRYRHGERQSHATHHDGHAIVTAVVSLSTYGEDYLGGLYVATGHGQRLFLALDKGDVAIHRSTLLHGVKVHDVPDNNDNTTERWSWILWYRDSTTCQDHSDTWFADCAAAGNPLCQQLHSDKSGSRQATVDLNRKAADQGAGTAAVKMGRAYLKTLPSDLPFDLAQATHYFDIAIRSHNPEGHYGRAHIAIAQANQLSGMLQQEQQMNPHEQIKASAAAEAIRNQQRQAHQREIESLLEQAVDHLEQAAMLGHVFACINLGMAHVYGYGVPVVDMELGFDWFVASHLPEGYFVAANYAASTGDKANYEHYIHMAHMLGYDQPWRKLARQHTGSGGASGIDINLPWPVSTKREGNLRPPEL